MSSSEEPGWTAEPHPGHTSKTRSLKNLQRICFLGNTRRRCWRNFRGYKSSAYVRIFYQEDSSSKFFQRPATSFLKKKKFQQFLQEFGLGLFWWFLKHFSNDFFWIFLKNSFRNSSKNFSNKSAKNFSMNFSMDFTLRIWTR